MKLINNFNIQNNDVITITGGGGKTSLMFALGKELSEAGIYHGLTTTAKICVADVPAIQCLIKEDIADVIHEIKKDPHREWVFGKERVSGQKISGFSETELKVLHDCLQNELGSFVIINEGDGSKRKPYKFYSDYEPIIPTITTKLIHVIGAEVLDQKIDNATFHRAELFGNPQAVFDEPVLKQVLENFITAKLDPQLAKNVMRILVINKADGENLKKAEKIGKIGGVLFDHCFISSLKEGWIQPVYE